MISNKRLPTLLLTAVAAVALTNVACGKKKKAGGADDKGASSAKAPADTTECQKYGTELCEIAGGEASPSCAGIKAATDLMAPAACKAGLANMDESKALYTAARGVCTALAEKLCKDIDEEPTTCKMVKEQTEKFPVERCKQMDGNYAQVLASVKQLAARNKPLDAEKLAKLSDGDVPGFGPKDAKVTVVEFSDFQCPYCSRAADAINEVKKKYKDKVRFVFRHFPLSFHKQAHSAAQASMAAHAQGKFWEYHDILFKNQSALMEPDLEKHAQAAGLQMALFKKAMKEEKYKAAVDADMALGTEVAVSGTPTIFVNGARVANGTDAAALSQAIDTALAGG